LKNYVKVKNVAVLSIVSLFLVYFVFLIFVNGVVAQQDGGAEVVSHSSYIKYESYKEIFSGTIYSGDFFHVVGEVQNVEAQNIKTESVTVIFYDGNDNVITEGPRHTSISPLEIIAPGQKSPFEIILLNQEASEKVARYEVSVASVITAENTPALEIPNHFSYVSHGTFYVVAEVQNTGGENVNGLKMLATFYDEYGTVIGADYTYSTDIDILVPGQKAPFRLSDYGRTSITEQIQTYSICGEGEIANEEPYREFQISNISTEISIIGSYEIRGEITNIGEISATFVKIVATFYDSSGGLIGSGYTYSDPIDLEPDQTGTFWVYLGNSELSSMVADYVLQFNCFEVTELPENRVPPEALFTCSTLEPLVNETITFDASGCNDVDGTVVNYFWNFGDGTTATRTSATITHSYSVEGTFSVTLTVTDNDGLTSSATQTLASVIPEFQPLFFFLLFAISTMIITTFRRKFFMRSHCEGDKKFG
jgi:hypothetical protein